MMKFFKDKEETILTVINKKNRLQRYSSVIVGIFLLAFAFNLFFLPNEIVYGGVSGLAIIAESVFDMLPSLFILYSSIVLLTMSFIFLGKEKSAKTIVGSLLFPLFVYLTADYGQYIDLTNLDPLIISLFGGLITGFGAGLIFKAGFTTGGTDIINQIVSKYFKVSIGKAMLMTDGLIVLAGGFFFGIETAIYAIIVLYIISVMTDKVILGVSQSKAFYIITDKEKEVKAFILENLAHGMTVLDAHGGYTGEKGKVLMCVIPTKEYFKFKEGIKLIDDDAFFVVTDAYEVGGNYK